MATSTATAFMCAECGRALRPSVEPNSTPHGSRLVRLVRDKAGHLHDWGTDDKTSSPSALVCDQCHSLPRYGDVRVTSERTFEAVVRQMPSGAVFGWPYATSRYLASELLFRQYLPRTWAALQQPSETHRRVKQKRGLLQWFFSLISWRRTGRK